MKSKPITADELLDRLARDPEYLEMRRRKEAERQAREAKLVAAEKPLRDALAEVGYRDTSAWDLSNTRYNYDSALPVLAGFLDKQHLLQEPERDILMEGVARSLGVKAGFVYWPQLVRKYEEIEDASMPHLKEGLAVTLAKLVRDSVMSDLAKLMKDRSNGITRIFFVAPLRRSKRADAQAALASVADDPEMAVELEADRKRVLKNEKRKAGKGAP